MVEDKSALQINISGLIKVIIIIAILLALLSIGLNVYYYSYNELAYVSSLFNLDKENNIPTRFSSELLVAASLLFFIIYRIKRKSEKKFLANWLILSLIFLMMGLDESVQLHEQTSQLLRDYVKGLYFAWVIPGAIFVLIFAFTYLKFFLSLEARWKKLFFFSAFLYVSGALLMEVVGNFYFFAAGQDNLGYVMITNIEEILEFSGIILLIYTLCSYIMSINPCYKIEIKK